MQVDSGYGVEIRCKVVYKDKIYITDPQQSTAHCPTGAQAGIRICRMIPFSKLLSYLSDQTYTPRGGYTTVHLGAVSPSTFGDRGT